MSLLLSGEIGKSTYQIYLKRTCAEELYYVYYPTK